MHDLMERRTIMHQGQCLCGKVKLSTTQDISALSVCHCSMCLRWNGGPGFSIDCKSDLKIEGEEYITRYDSSSWGERAFCKHCGSHLFYLLKETHTYYVSAGLFPDAKESKLTMQIYIDSKPHYYNFVEKTPMLTEQDIMNMFN